MVAGEACAIFHKRVSSARLEQAKAPLSEPGDESSSTASQLGRYGGHGITLGLAVALFAWLGTLLDDRLGTGPLFVLVGTFTAFGAGLYRMLRDLSDANEESAGRSDD